MRRRAGGPSLPGVIERREAVEMYVVARHRITQAERFFSVAEAAAEDAPAGVYGRQFCPSQDLTEAVCLWEAESVGSVEHYLDPLIGDAAENAYFAVDLEHAIGVPTPIRSTVG
jgi:hypothetical protein